MGTRAQIGAILLQLRDDKSVMLTMELRTLIALTTGIKNCCSLNNIGKFIA